MIVSIIKQSYSHYCFNIDFVFTTINKLFNYYLCDPFYEFEKLDYKVLLSLFLKYCHNTATSTLKLMAENIKSKINIQQIAGNQTQDLRHKVLWPHKDPSFVILPEDASGYHFGAFLDNGIILNIIK